MTIFDKVKLALRISHTLLDAEITDVINSARQEMIRAGVAQEVANGSTELVETAIKTYALHTLPERRLKLTNTRSPSGISWTTSENRG